MGIEQTGSNSPEDGTLPEDPEQLIALERLVLQLYVLSKILQQGEASRNHEIEKPGDTLRKPDPDDPDDADN